MGKGEIFWQTGLTRCVPTVTCEGEGKTAEGVGGGKAMDGKKPCKRRNHKKKRNGKEFHLGKRIQLQLVKIGDYAGGPGGLGKERLEDAGEKGGGANPL